MRVYIPSQIMSTRINKNIYTELNKSNMATEKMGNDNGTSGLNTINLGIVRKGRRRAFKHA